MYQIVEIDGNFTLILKENSIEGIFQIVATFGPTEQSKRNALRIRDFLNER